MDYKEQQIQEIEALQAIYLEDEYEMVCSEYPEIAVRMNLKSCQDPDNEDDHDFEVSLLLELPETYPDVIPKMSLEGVEELFSEERLQEVIEVLEKEASENVGMVMVFTIVSAFQEEIGKLVDGLRHKATQKIEEEKEKVEAVARKKFEGTIVTQESFLAWKRMFDEERQAQLDKKIKEREAALAGRLTGRSLFLKDATLNLSDVALIEQSVEIDETLFDEELDGLDLDDLDEDED